MQSTGTSTSSHRLLFCRRKCWRATPLQAPLRCKPVLFAGLLEHWGQLGPAEIESKRRFTYRYCIWRAHTLGVQMKFPPAHPFNPLKLLRLAIAAGASFEACLTIFRFVFRDGHSADDASAWQRLTETLGLPDAQTRVASDAGQAAAAAKWRGSSSARRVRCPDPIRGQGIVLGRGRYRNVPHVLAGCSDILECRNAASRHHTASSASQSASGSKQGLTVRVRKGRMADASPPSFV